MKNTIHYIVRIVIGILLFSCAEEKNEIANKTDSLKIGFPLSLQQKLPTDFEKFNSVSIDTSRIRFLINLGGKEPVHRTNIYRHIIRYANDSANFLFKLHTIRLLAKSFAPTNLLDSVVYYTTYGISCSQNNAKYARECAEYYRDLGNIYVNFSRNAEAISNFDKAIQIATKYNIPDLFRYLTETGRTYAGMQELKKAQECYTKGRDYAKKAGDHSLLVFALNSLGDVCRIEKKYEESIRNHELANKAHFESSGEPYEQWACTSMGKSYLFSGDYSNARKFFGIALKLATANEANDLVAQSYMNLAICDYREGSVDKALISCNKAYEISQKIPQLDIKAAVTKNLATLYKKKKQFEKAFSFLELHKLLDDSLQNTESDKKFAEAEYKSKEDKLLYKIEQDKQALHLEQERSEQESKRHKIVIGFVSLFLLLSVAFAFFIYRSLRQNKEKNKIIEEKQKEILQSIRYAQRIQQSLLPQEKFIERILNKKNLGEGT